MLHAGTGSHHFSSASFEAEVRDARGFSRGRFTGEGKMDAQTLMGKAPQGVLKLALKYHKPIVAFAGQVNHKDTLLQAGFSDVRCINHDDLPLMMQLREGMTSLAKEVRQYLKETYDV